jgi:hypothetical protein
MSNIGNLDYERDLYNVGMKEARAVIEKEFPESFLDIPITIVSTDMFYHSVSSTIKPRELQLSKLS